MNGNDQCILTLGIGGNVPQLLASQAMLGGQPPQSRRRHKPTADNTQHMFPEFTRLQSRADGRSPFLTVLMPQVSAEPVALLELPVVVAKPQTHVVRARTADITVSYLWRELGYLSHWLTSRTSLATVDLVLAVWVYALLGYERCYRHLFHRQRPPFIAEIGPILADRQQPYDLGGETGSAWCA